MRDQGILFFCPGEEKYGIKTYMSPVRSDPRLHRCCRERLFKLWDKAYTKAVKKIDRKDLSVLQEAPFTDRGSIVEVFTDMSVWRGIRSVIEHVNANAAA